ncbi:hypothetical protein GQ44DRAFT_220017 [Phaeosphaeriaceae sp. PMI808]|nr:hypothetical protein GQ44DRAFT_220017 [Phaeosphaeriaceae sp. PMI808]
MSTVNSHVPKHGGGRCFLFELPRELRDLIYQYALCHDEGITVLLSTYKSYLQIHGPGKRLHSGPIIPANTLGFVCRQLWHETQNLTTKVNTNVVLYCMDFKTPSSYALNAYLGQIGIAAVARLRKITVSGKLNLKTSDEQGLRWEEGVCYFNSFKPICLAHPHIVVIIRFHRFLCSDEKSWLALYLSVREVILGPDSIPATLVMRSRRHWPTSNTVELLSLPKNLRFSELDAFPRQAISRSALGPVASVKDNMAFAERLWEDGI